MGQYYKPILLKEDKKSIDLHFHPIHYDNGMKLMEHSYIGNALVGAAEYFIEDDPCNIVWAGDYADNEPNIDDNLYFIASCEEYEPQCMTPQYIGKKQKKGMGYVLKMFCKTSKRTRYIINHSKKQFVDKTKCPILNDEYKMIIHPLPLLTADGNGRGGGDYRGNNKNLVGTWARDYIEVSTSTPPADYTEIIPNFMWYGYEYIINDTIVECKVPKKRIKSVLVKSTY